MRYIAMCTCLTCRREISGSNLNRHINSHALHPLEYYQKLYDSGLSLRRIMKQESGVSRLWLQNNLTFRSLSEANKNASILYPQIWTKERRDNLSKSMHKAVKANPDVYSYPNICKRVKRKIYKNQKFHSSWEVIVAEFLDKHLINWTRNVRPIEYVFEGKTHLYFPDFYLPDYDRFIEVKGYAVDKDKAKWNSIPDKLIVLRKNEINKIKNNNFILELGEG